MLGRRFLLLVAVLMGLTALAASLAPRQPVTPERRSEATATPTPGSSSTVTIVEKELAITDEEERVTVNEGELVELTVSGDERDGVVLLDRVEAIDPLSPARFSVLANRPGSHPIELLDSGRQVGTLVVREAG